jgi:hypothetical protein
VKQLPLAVSITSIAAVKTIRRVVRACWALVLMVLIAILVERVRSQLAVRSWKKTVAKGQKLNVLELIPAPLPVESNAAPELIAAAKQLPFRSDQCPRLLKFLTSDQAAVSASMEMWVSEVSNGSGEE